MRPIRGCQKVLAKWGQTSKVGHHSSQEASRLQPSCPYYLPTYRTHDASLRCLCCRHRPLDRAIDCPDLLRPYAKYDCRSCRKAQLCYICAAQKHPATDQGTGEHPGRRFRPKLQGLAVNGLPGPTAWCRIATLSTLAGRTLQPGMSFRPTYLKNLRKSTMLWNGG